MAKRSAPRSRPQADDAMAAAAAAPPRARRSRAGSAENPANAALRTASTDDVGAVDAGPSEDEIRERAYQHYLERGGGHGMDFDDWLTAERELKRQKSKV